MVRLELVGELLLLLEEGRRRIVEVEDLDIDSEGLSIERERPRIVMEERRTGELVVVVFGIVGNRSFVVGVGSRCSLRIVAVRSLKFVS